MLSETSHEDESPSASEVHGQEASDRPLDKVYAKKRVEITPFEFNQEVVQVFPDMIERSVPGYRATLEMTKVVANTFVRPDTVVYDLGCSLGATTRAIIEGLKGVAESPSYRIVAIDNAPAMIEQCRRELQVNNEHITLDLCLGDILEQPIHNASLVVLNYTLQFIPLDKRLPLLTRICEGLIPGGVLILSEKVVFPDDKQQETLTSLHHGFKRMQGYSDLEISQKRTALENVLIPESIAVHQERLSVAGFSTHLVWFQSLNFVSILAIK